MGRGGPGSEIGAEVGKAWQQNVSFRQHDVSFRAERGISPCLDGTARYRIGETVLQRRARFRVCDGEFGTARKSALRNPQY